MLNLSLISGEMHGQFLNGLTASSPAAWGCSGAWLRPYELKDVHFLKIQNLINRNLIFFGHDICTFQNLIIKNETLQM